MGTLAAGQVLRWTLRNAANSSVHSSLQLGRCPPPPPPLCFGCRLFCSSGGHSELPSTQPKHEPAPLSRAATAELSTRCLIDMGFTDIQAGHIYESVSKARGGSAAKHCLSTLTALVVLGLNSASVVKLLDKCPELYTVNESHLQQRISNLRKLGLVEGSIQRVVAHYPAILTMPVKTVNNVVMFLREKCLFTVQQVTDILRDSPFILQENLAQLEYKFQYVYFRMGVKQAEMVKARLFRFTLDEVRCRHCFLERRGLYQTPDKKGQTIVINPKLDSILNIDQETFLTHIAKASVEEYEVFQRLIAREWQKQVKPDSNFIADSDDEDEDEDEDEEEETGKSSYRKRRKKEMRAKDLRT